MRQWDVDAIKALAEGTVTRERESKVHTCTLAASRIFGAEPVFHFCNNQRMKRIIELSHGKPGQVSPEQIPLEPVTGLPGMVLQSIGPTRHEVRVPFHDSQARGHAILIQTGWDQYWGTEKYWEPGPYLSQDVIFRLIRAGARLVGVDFWEVGEIDTEKLQVVTNLCNLSALPRVGFRFHLAGGRAFGEITTDTAFSKSPHDDVRGPQ